MDLEHLEILQQSLVFRGLSLPEMEKALDGSISQIKTYGKGDFIAHAGTECKHARVVLTGKVSGEMMDMAGKILKIEDILPASMIAPAFLYGSKRHYPVNVIAATRSKVWQMQQNDFSQLLQKDILLLNNFLNAISSRAQFLSDKIRFISFPSIRSKLAAFILLHSEGEDKFKIPFTHRQLAELFGVARPSLSREISMLNNKKVISSERDEMHILNREALSLLVNE